jgi:hypothetical protein
VIGYWLLVWWLVVDGTLKSRATRGEAVIEEQVAEIRDNAAGAMCVHIPTECRLLNLCARRLLLCSLQNFVTVCLAETLVFK